MTHGMRKITDMKSFLLVVGFIVGFVALMVPLTLLRGYVAYKCWEWFMVPTFGLPQVGIVSSLGLMTVIGIFIPNHVDPKDDEHAEKWFDRNRTILTHLLTPPMVLLFGYIYHLFM